MLVPAATPRPRDVEHFNPVGAALGLVFDCAISTSDERQAVQIAGQRREYMDGRRRPCNDLGTAANARAELLGIRAELACYRAITAVRLPCGPLNLTDGPITQADLIVSGVKYECKATPIRSGFMCVSARQHALKIADFYLFVRVADNGRCRVYVLPHSAVNHWDLRSGEVVEGRRRSSYRSAPVGTLRRLAESGGVL